MKRERPAAFKPSTSCAVFAQNIKLREVAETLLETGLRHGIDPATTSVRRRWPSPAVGTETTLVVAPRATLQCKVTPPALSDTCNPHDRVERLHVVLIPSPHLRSIS